MTLMQGIIDFKKDEATEISKADKWAVTARGQRLNGRLEATYTMEGRL
jgi:hypothetical protein